MSVDEWDDPAIGITILEKGSTHWYDKYFHFWQRKNVADIYLKKEGYNQFIIVVLQNGNKGKCLLQSNEEGRPKDSIQWAYNDAVNKSTIMKSDYEKYLKPTLRNN